MLSSHRMESGLGHRHCGRKLLSLQAPEALGVSANTVESLPLSLADTASFVRETVHGASGQEQHLCGLVRDIDGSTRNIGQSD